MKPGLATLLAGLLVIGLVTAIPVAGAVGSGVVESGAAGDHVSGESSIGGESMIARSSGAVTNSVSGPSPVANTDTDEVTDSDAEASGSDESNENRTLPGERLGGVIGVQAAEVNDEVESRSFERQVGTDRAEEQRADAVANRLQRAEQRLTGIEARHEELRERRDAGEISEGEYRARTARLAAETAAIERSTNRSAEVANDLPHELRTERGIDDDSITTLRERAHTMSGPEVAEIARGIAGPNVGGPVGTAMRPDHAGPPSANETRGGGPPATNETRDGGPHADNQPSAGNVSTATIERGVGASGSQGQSNVSARGDIGTIDRGHVSSVFDRLHGVLFP